MTSNIDKLSFLDLKQTSDCFVISFVGGGGKTSTAFWLASYFRQCGLKVCLTTSTKMYYPENSDIDYFISKDKKTRSSSNLSKYINSFEDISDSSITFYFSGIIKSEQSIKAKNKVTGISLTEIRHLKRHSPFDVILVEADGAKGMALKAPAKHEPCLSELSDMVISLTGAEMINQPVNRKLVHRWDEFASITGMCDGQTAGIAELSKLIDHPLGMFKSAPHGAKKIVQINKLDKIADPDAFCSLATELLQHTEQPDEVWLTSMQPEQTLIKRIVRE